MDRSKKPTAIDLAAERLREIVLEADEGTFIGSEETLITKLGCSRSSVRQVARVLEREGLLLVRRGINGGYFGARPDAGTIEGTVGTYLATLDVNAQDVTLLASALWVEAMRKAAGSDREAAQALAARLRKRIKLVKDGASFKTIRDLEFETQDAVFDLTDSKYVKLIFDINAAFSRRKFHHPIEDDDSPAHALFVRDWKDAKSMELNAIEKGDRDLAILAARYSRKIWYRRVYSRLITSPIDESVGP